MKERHINLEAWEVRAILEGRKTQTRRLVKLQPGERLEEWHGRITFFADEGKKLLCPYGQPGDRLWVRETFEVVRETCSYEVEEYDYFPWDAELYGPPQHALRAKCPRGGERAIVLYRAEEEEPIERWRSSIHMPRWASRITLEVTGARVERLQDISEADAIAEGIQPSELGEAASASLQLIKGEQWPAAVLQYAELWQSINGPGSWEVNPWVWVVEFRRCQ